MITPVHLFLLERQETMSKHLLKTAAFGAVLCLCSPAFAAQGAARKTPPDSMVIAEVNGTKITLGDIRAIQNSEPRTAMVPVQAILPPLRENLILLTLLSDEARKEKVNELPDVRRMIKTAEKQILANAYLKRRITGARTKDKLQKMYERFKKENPPQEGMSASHILVKTRAEAEELIKQLQNGAGFDELVEKTAQKNGHTGGDLGVFTRETIPPEIAEAVFALKEGEITKTPVQTQYGFHILKAGPRQMMEVPSYDEVEDELIEKLNMETRDEIVKEIRARATIKETPIEYDESGNIK
jgi:peptidyl-prolyl cis-trans isomerase C